MSRRSVFASLLTVVLFGGPLIACTVPGAQLSTDEKDCCKQMGGACRQNGSGIPRSHPCCESVVQPQRDLLPSSIFSFSGPTLVVSLVELPAELPLGEQSSPFVGSFSHTYSPPGEAVGTSAALRI